MVKDYSLNRLLVLFTVAGFMLLLVDSILEHWATFAEELWSYIPVVFSGVGLILGSLTLLRWNGRSIRRFHLLLLTTFLVSAAGLYFHIAEEDDDEELTAAEREHEQKEKERPLLAPLAFAAVAAVGLLGTSRRWPAEVVSHE